MQAYEKGAPAYFATPPVNLIYAFHEALSQITKGSPSLKERFDLHRQTSAKIKAAAQEIGLASVPVDPQASANGMTAVYCPEGVKSSDLVPAFLKKGVVIAGGLGSRKDTYFRIGYAGLVLPSETVLTILRIDTWASPRLRACEVIRTRLSLH